MTGIQIKILAALALAAVVFSCMAWLLGIGGDIERAKIERENANAVERAEDYTTKLGDCRNSGGVYDFATGKCRGRENGSGWLPSWLTR